jgi:polysaccharide biosynthesis/export protein
VNRVITRGCVVLGAVFVAGFMTGCCGNGINYPYEREAFEQGSYRVGTGDVLHISVWGNNQLTGNTTVRPDGQMTMPLVGDVQAEGRTPEEIRDDLRQRLVRYIEAPNVAVSVAQINSYRIYVTGRVNQAGEFTPDTPVTVLQALALARGWNEFADTDHIVVMRRDESGTRRIPFAYDEVVQCGRLEMNIVLRSGDTIVVP